MKKILFPLAVVSAMSFASIAQAQSNVTVYGLIDLGVGRDVGKDSAGVLQGAASRLGFKGQEDLGGGLKASFHLQHRFNADTGAATNANKFWHADSWVGLEGNFGQVRLGRMFTPSYEYVILPGDVFQHSRVSSNLTSQTGKSTAPIRFDNTINYNVQKGGLRLGASFAPHEGEAGKENAYSVAMSYTAGNLYLAAGHESPNVANSEWNTLTARWGDDALKVYGFFGIGHNALDENIRSYSIGASARVGAGQLKASYARMDNRELDTKVQDKFGLGYYYTLSKRTTVYTNIAHDRALADDKNGVDVGMMHAF